MRNVWAGVLAAAALAACGGSNPGGGTKTLYVMAQAVSDGSTDGTVIAVEVRQGSSSGDVLTDATVTLHGDKTGDFTLPFTGINWGSFRAGSYLKQGATWDTGWSISVRRGNDALDAYLQAPGISTLTSPIGGTTFRRADGKPLSVQWKDSENRRADVTTLEFQQATGANLSLSNDPFQVDIDANRLQATDKERLTLTRKNEISLNGGVPGSLFRASTTHRIEFRVE